MSRYILSNVSAERFTSIPEAKPSLPSQGMFTIEYGLDQNDGYYVMLTPVDSAAVDCLWAEFKVDTFSEQSEDTFLDYSNYQFTGDPKRKVSRGWIYELLACIGAPSEHLHAVGMDLDFVFKPTQPTSNFKVVQDPS